MRTNFVLIDSENVRPAYIEKLKHEHFRVVVFIGANLKRLDFAIVNAVQSRRLSRFPVSYKLKVPTPSRNPSGNMVFRYTKDTLIHWLI